MSIFIDSDPIIFSMFSTRSLRFFMVFFRISVLPIRYLLSGHSFYDLFSLSMIPYLTDLSNFLISSYNDA